tara:strand:+ start:1180 stop:1626 length:447 start_codon:yes stop_codon:yes gene_type:complete
MKQMNTKICALVDNKIGENFTHIAPINMYGVTVGDNVFIGPFCEIQKNVIIGCDVRIQSHSFICENTYIGDDTFIAHGVMFTNDKFSDGKLSKDYLPTYVGQRCRIGSNVTLLPVKICDDVTIGAGSVVTKDITTPGVYAGNPARKIK